MEKGRLFFGGLPTDADIKALREAFPDSSLTENRVIPFEDVEQVINCDRSSHRFKGVVWRWRKLVENETGSVVVGSERGIGFKILPAAEKVELSFSYLRASRRKARRGYVVSTRVDPAALSSEDRQRLTMVQKANAAIVSMDQIKYRGELPQLV